MKVTLNILFLFALFQSSAQNLVPNPSFEIYTDCPSNTGWLPGADYWNDYLISPDYFNSCANYLVDDADAPYNLFGFQFPASGEAYVGMVTSFTQNGNPSLIPHEGVGAQLTSPLIQGTKYYVTFKANLTLNASTPATTATDKLGIRFTSNTSYTAIDNNAHVYATSVIMDTMDWTLVEGTFIADSNYTHLMIGNFFDHANTTQVELLSSSSQYEIAYYYVDDICVSPDSATCYGGSGASLIELPTIKRQLLRLTDLMGRETQDKPNTLLIYVYNDGTTEKVFRVE